MLVNMNNTDNYIKSDIENPIGFFEEFFPKGYFSLYYRMVIENEINKIVIIDDNIGDFLETTEVLTQPEVIQEQLTYLFWQEVKIIIEEQIEISVDYTKKAILQKDTPKAKKELIHTLFDKMSMIIDRIGQISIGNQFALDFQSILIDYYKKVNKEYPRYVSKSNSSYSKYLILPKEIKTAIYSLKMITPKLLKIKTLLQELKDYGFLEKNLSVDKFRQAFDGSLIEQPLNIKWMKVVNKECNIASIIQFLDLLKKREYIDSYHPYKRLSSIFVKNNGDKIINWKQANYREISNKYGKKKPLDDLKEILSKF